MGDVPSKKIRGGIEGMNGLADRLKRLIAAQGPISVADYMATCLYDPAKGYYSVREPFGAKGDFTTAPEISQMFGELLAVWLYDAWKEAGSPLPAIVAEIGPGRGTLMQDMLRVFSKLDRSFLAVIDVALVETSPRLTEMQKARLASSPTRIGWHRDMDSLPDKPLFIVGNEIFDAVPIRQYVRVAEGWRERVVGLDADGNFTFLAGPGAPDAAFLPPAARLAPQGAVVEIAPARSALMQAIAERLTGNGGAGLFVDYGHTESAVGDTLQALYQHGYDHVFAHPGEADLTSHVDFAVLASVAREAGLKTKLSLQGDFLLRLGLLERAGAIGAGGGRVLQERLSAEVERLAGPEQMGTLFKVLELTAPHA